jgi:hypothetical protein
MKNPTRFMRRANNVARSCQREEGPVVSDPAELCGKSQPKVGRWGALLQKRYPIDGIEGARAPGVLKVGEDQFLVLLLVVYA